MFSRSKDSGACVLATQLKSVRREPAAMGSLLYEVLEANRNLPRQLRVGLKKKRTGLDFCTALTLFLAEEEAAAPHALNC